ENSVLTKRPFNPEKARLRSGFFVKLPINALRARPMSSKHMMFLFCSILWSGSALAGDWPGGSGGQNAPGQAEKPYLVLVSIDGFRWDFPDL
ncbi:hypothetical protein DF186_15790, partial [Enterococcus hirae]